MRQAIIVGLSVLLPIISGFSQETVENYYATKIERPIVIDGKLDETSWQKSMDLSGLIFVHRDRIDPHLVKSEVKILYQNSLLYIGFHCLDPQPELIEAYILEADEDIRIDDSVYVLIDVYENLDKYYFFGTNTNSVLFDGTITKDGRTIDTAYKGDWDSAVQLKDDGWDVELAIDLSSLMFKPEPGITIGVALARVVPRLDTSFWMEPLDPAFRLSQMEGLPSIGFKEPERAIQIIPYIMPSLRNGDDIDFRVGIDIPFYHSEKTNGYVTLNPDFATVEPDLEVFNISRYELYLPEKRDYFNADQNDYQLPHEQLFYSKRIGDIYGGARLRGEFGPYKLNATVNQSKQDDLMGLGEANYSSLRFQRDFFNVLSAGILVANKYSDNKHYGTVGLDTSMSLADHFNLAGQIAFSYGNYDSDNLLFSFFPSFENESSYFHVGYVHVGKQFADDANLVGYIWDDDRREINSVFEKTFIIQKWGIEQIKYISLYDVFWGFDGTLRSWQIDQGMVLEKQNRFEVYLIHTQEMKLFEKDFRNHRTKIFIGLDTQEWQLFNLSFMFGQNFDQVFRLGEINKKLKISTKLSIEGTFQYLHYPDLSAQKEDQLHTFLWLKARYAVTRRLHASAFFQINDETDKKNYQLFLNYRITNAHSYVQLGYQFGDPRYGIIGKEDHMFYLKVRYRL